MVRARFCPFSPRRDHNRLILRQSPTREESVRLFAPRLIAEQEVCVDAAYFRTRAKVAREMAQDGEDARIVQLLLELAADLDAEADSIEATALPAPSRAKRLGAGGLDL